MCVFLYLQENKWSIIIMQDLSRVMIDLGNDVLVAG